MNRRGEWIVPYYNGQPWFEKPILIYWLAKPSISIFGAEWGPRLPSVLASLATIGIVAWFCRRRFGGDVAALSVLILAGSLLFVAPGRMMLTDPLLVLCLTGAFAAFYESLVGDRRLRLLAALFLGFSVLAKGPVGLVLFGAVAAWTYWREPELRGRFRGYWLVGGLVVLAIVSLWYVPVYLARPDGFVEEFLIRQNLGRLAGGDAAHNPGFALGLVYYIPVVLLGMLPWSGWIPVAALRAREDPALRFCLAWAGSVLILFTLSGSKLPHYVMPALPPLAILVAAQLARSGPRLRLIMLAWIFIVAAFVNAGFLAWYEGRLGGAASQAEAHMLARLLRDKPNVAVFRLSRLERSLGEGKLAVQQTSLPSLLLYMDRTVLAPEGPKQGDPDPRKDTRQLIAAPKPLWIFTRAGRFTASDRDLVTRSGQRLSAPISGASGDYEVYVMDRATPTP